MLGLDLRAGSLCCALFLEFYGLQRFVAARLIALIFIVFVIFSFEAAGRAAATYFSCPRKKSKQKKRAPAICVPLVFAAQKPSGQPAVLGCGVRRRTHCAAGAAAFKQLRRS